MLRLLREERGFTLIELVMVIVVLGILAAVAIPKFTDLRSNARESAEDGVIGAVRGGIAAAHAESLMSAATNEWPSSLETSGETTTVFESVLEQGVPTGAWLDKQSPAPSQVSGSVQSVLELLPQGAPADSYGCTQAPAPSQ